MIGISGRFPFGIPEGFLDGILWGKARKTSLSNTGRIPWGISEKLEDFFEKYQEEIPREFMKEFPEKHLKELLGKYLENFLEVSPEKFMD